MFGGAEEDRTPDLRIANATLSQLSYRPNEARAKLYLNFKAPRNTALGNYFQTNSSVATTGAWSDGCSLRRGSLSMTQATQRLTSGADSST